MRARRSGSRTTSAPVVSGPQSHFCPEIVRKSRPSAPAGIAPTDWAPSASTGTPLRSRSSASGSTAPVVQSTCDVAISLVRGVTAARIRSGSGSTTTTVATDAAERAEQAEVLVGRRHDLVAGLEPEPAEHDRAALARRGRQRHLLGRRADQRRRAAAGPRPGAGSSPRSTACPSAPPPDRAATPAVTASATGRGSGPNVPALRYAIRSSTGNRARPSSNVTPAPRGRSRRERDPRARCRRRRAGHAATARRARSPLHGRARGRSRRPRPCTRRGAARGG